MNKHLFYLILLFFCSQYGWAQKHDHDLIQFSGVIVEMDSLEAIPFTQVIIKNTQRGTISDYFGFFSFVAHRNDTIVFSSLGFKPATFIIPDSLTTNRYSLIQVMTADTVMLMETVIYPWPTVEQFKQAFVNIEIPDDDLERAKKNLALAEMKERMKVTGMDGSMNFKNYINNTTSKLYYAGQYPSNNLLNPIAWAKFIKAWREGKLKIQTK